jgi:hypothetical protein
MFLIPEGAQMRIKPTSHESGCECAACNPKRRLLPAVREPDEIVQPAQPAQPAQLAENVIDVEATEPDA